MSAPIQAGDLVIVLRNHCSDRRVGRIFVVQRVQNSQIHRCNKCKKLWNAGQIGVEEINGLNGIPTGYPLAWLKRIDPLGKQERDEIMRELEA